MGNYYLIKFILHLSQYRGGSDLYDVCVINDTELELIERAMKEKWNVYFGEVMGKHSEVIENMGDSNMVTFEILSDDYDEITLFNKWFTEDTPGNLDILFTLDEHLAEHITYDKSKN